MTVGAETAPAPRTDRIPSFVHQRNRLTEGQQSAWDRLWHRHGRDVADLVEGREPYDPPAWFGRTAPLVLEIGSGMGESTAALAAAAPDVDHMAVEVFEPGLAQLLLRVESSDLTNLLLLRGDAVALLDACIPVDSLDGIRIFFPDPWPKRRHRKRRLVQPGFVGLAASRLRPGAILHMATDWADYAVQMRDVADAERRLQRAPEAGPNGFVPRPDWRPVSKFEQRAITEGREVSDLMYEKHHRWAKADIPRVT
ncbi:MULTISPECIES: tRNA (guanosine(46)-N7)-methyltransferase TrmB [Pseudonocardia]|nr:tRNA (guanosine(46)-N7)-methyltransferase TrmB [Pseudonocardia dioxanivorans]